MKSLLLLTLLISSFSFSQLTSGTLIWEVTHEQKEPNYISPFEIQNTRFIVDFNENFTRLHQTGQRDIEGITVYDDKNELMLRLWSSEYEYSDSIALLRYTNRDLQDFFEGYEGYNETDTVIHEFPNDREILGYMCKRTVYEISNTTKTTITIWSTDQIKKINHLADSRLRIDGMPLEISMTSNYYSYTQKVISISPMSASTPALSLIPPKGYVLQLPRYNLLESESGYQELTLPAEVMTYPEYKTGWDGLRNQLIKAREKHSPKVNPEDYRLDIIEISMEIDANGTVTEVNFTSDTNNEKLRDEMTAILKKSGSWKPAIVSGTSVPSKMGIRFY